MKYGHRYWTLRAIVANKKRANVLWLMFGKPQ